MQVGEASGHTVSHPAAGQPVHSVDRQVGRQTALVDRHTEASLVCRRGVAQGHSGTWTYVWVVLHEDQELRCSLVGRQEAGDVVVLQQRQAVDGALVAVVLLIGRAEHFDGDAALVEAAAVDCAVMTSTNQLPEMRTEVVRDFSDFTC